MRYGCMWMNIENPSSSNVWIYDVFIHLFSNKTCATVTKNTMRSRTPCACDRMNDQKGGGVYGQSESPIPILVFFSDSHPFTVTFPDGLRGVRDKWVTTQAINKTL